MGRDLVEVDDLGAVVVAELVIGRLAPRVDEEVEVLQRVVVVLREGCDLVRLEGRKEAGDLKR